MKNKDIDVCGLGNALVDLQFQIKDSDITEMNFAKGEMRLVELEQQKKLLDTFAKYNYNQCSGGSAANTIIAFSQFGGKAAYMTLLGNDNFGNFYSDEFKQLGIELQAAMLDSDPTGTCAVLITPDAERTMLTYLGATSKFSPEHLNREYIERAKWLYIEGYYFSGDSTSEAIFKAVEIAKESNTKIAVSFSDAFIIDVFRERLEKVVKNADLVFCNETEAKKYTNCANSEDAFAELCKICPNVAMTLGAEGSLLMWDGRTYKIPSFPTKAVDTTGAGDMFAGAFMYGILYLNSPELAGILGSAAASKVVSQLGARLQNEHKNIIEMVTNY